MAQVKNGDTVKVHYTGKLEDGTVFDSSEGRDPLEFTVGAGQLIPGFDAAVVGMAAGENKTVTIPSEQAYGPHNQEMVVQAERSQFPPETDPQIGMQFQGNAEGGQTLVVTVTAVEGDKITLDGNHPLAGKDLTFDIEMVEVA